VGIQWWTTTSLLHDKYVTICIASENLTCSEEAYIITAIQA
jgi:hypothetical protein